jgi:hypothetical protein
LLSDFAGWVIVEVDVPEAAHESGVDAHIGAPGSLIVTGSDVF